MPLGQLHQIPLRLVTDTWGKLGLSGSLVGRVHSSGRLRERIDGPPKLK